MCILVTRSSLACGRRYQVGVTNLLGVAEEFNFPSTRNEYGENNLTRNSAVFFIFASIYLHKSKRGNIKLFRKIQSVLCPFCIVIQKTECDHTCAIRRCIHKTYCACQKSFYSKLVQWVCLCAGGWVWGTMCVDYIPIYLSNR